MNFYFSMALCRQQRIVIIYSVCKFFVTMPPCITFYDFLSVLQTGEPPNLCCNAAQLQELKDGMSLARQMLSRCPVCYRNILKFNCNFMCSPEQSLFMKATKTEPVPEGEGGENL